MKNLIVPALVAIAGLALSAQGMAADEHEGHGGHGAMHSQASAETSLTEGLVKKVDKAAGKLTLSHGPLSNGMPGMTMAFPVKNPAWLDQVKVGDRIRFRAAEVKGVLTVTAIEAGK
jgi:Cu/Ag efflux protein CusF